MKLTYIFRRVAVMRHSDAVLNDERGRLRQVNNFTLQNRVVRTRSELKLSVKAVGNARVLMTQHSLRFAIDDLPSTQAVMRTHDGAHAQLRRLNASASNDMGLTLTELVDVPNQLAHL